MILLNAQVDSLTTRKDRTIKLTFVTQELPPKDAGELFGMQNELVGLGIARNDLTQSEIDLLKESKYNLDDIPSDKSPSQRMRNVLFRIWEQQDGGYSDFNLYYLNRMERLIEQLKSKLD